MRRMDLQRMSVSGLQERTSFEGRAESEITNGNVLLKEVPGLLLVAVSCSFCLGLETRWSDFVFYEIHFVCGITG